MPRAKPPTPPAPRPGERLTLREVARTLGVSVATVSNAYNRPDQLSAELRERILAAAQELGYQGPDPLARSLRRGRTGVIGVVYDAPLDYAFADPAASLFLGRVAHTVEQAGLNLLLLSSPGDRYPDAQPLRRASVDGLIVYCAAKGSTLLSTVLERGLPTVLVDQWPQPGVTQVGIDDAAGAAEAALHLAALGHQHIGVVCMELTAEPSGGPVTPEREAQPGGYHTTAERLRGYRAAQPGAQLYLTETVQHTPQEGEARTLELLRAHPQITALLCMSDVLAQGALSAARQLELRVPEDLSVVGYDDVPSSAALHLTTVWQPTADKGDHAGEAMLRLLGGQPTPDVRLPTRLIVRGTTAAPRP